VAEGRMRALWWSLSFNQQSALIFLILLRFAQQVEKTFCNSYPFLKWGLPEAQSVTYL
jgi:hypothetical protein